jgi:Domain of unknown function (DUF1772)
MAHTVDTGVSLSFGARVGHRRGCKALRPQSGRGSLERGTAGVAYPVAIRPRFPVDPGKFFIPTSLSTLVAAFGALISGWKTPFGYRVWLWLSAVLILAVWIFTAVAFWPSNAALYAAASGATGRAKGEAEVIRLAHQWVTYDWWRVAMMGAGFVSAVRAISVPVPTSTASLSSS